MKHTFDVAAIHGLGSVSPAYDHIDKEIVPGTQLALPGTVLKWYDIHRADEPVPGEIRRLARLFLVDQGESGILNLRDQLGFVILHRCGKAFYFLLVAVWRNNNELWEAVYYKDATTPGFQLFPRESSPLGTFCVWELGAVHHEQQALVRFLRSNRNAVDLETYLDDQYAGVV